MDLIMTDRRTGKQTAKGQIEIDSGQMDIQIHSLTDRLIDRRIDGQMKRRTNRQTYIEPQSLKEELRYENIN